MIADTVLAYEGQEVVQGGGVLGPDPEARLTHTSVLAAEAVLGACFHHARSALSPRTRPGSNGQPPSPPAGRTRL